MEGSEGCGVFVLGFLGLASLALGCGVLGTAWRMGQTGGVIVGVIMVSFGGVLLILVLVEPFLASLDAKRTKDHETHG